MILTDIGYEKVVWLYLAQDRNQWRLVGWKNGNENSGSIKGEEFLDKMSDYQLFTKTLLHGFRYSRRKLFI